MKKLLILIVSFVLFLSCSESEETTSQTNSFFNIETGNLWVYKRYNYNNSTNNYINTNVIDSVFVTGDTLINSISYKKIHHHTYFDIVNNPSYYQSSLDIVRVDTNDHLVRPNGFVVHPGLDYNYEYTHSYYSSFYFDSTTGTNVQNLFGTADFQLSPGVLSLSVEGSQYNLYNYEGDFTGNQSLNIPDNTINYMYSEQIGAVLLKCPYVSGTGFYEDRLIYYEIN